MSNVVDSGGDRVFLTDADLVDSTPIRDRKLVSGRAFLVDVGLGAAWVGVTDLLLYQVGTYLSWALMLIVAIGFLAVLRLKVSHCRKTAWLAAAILLLAVKLVWCGSGLQIWCGLALLVCYGMALSGATPFLPEAVAFLFYMCAGAVERLRSYRVSRWNLSSGGDSGGASISDVERTRVAWSVVLPFLVVSSFAILFVLANPDVATGTARQLRILFESMGRVFATFEVVQGIFWMVSGLVLLGLLYPAQVGLWMERQPAELSGTKKPAVMYSAFRNTLLSVIVLFAVYLVFEFITLWFRDFPADFYYAGYAHQGAFWLTVALALATLVLSAVFRGDILGDERLASLKRLALIWSIENLLLSAAVYNRMLIYIDYNGMTRMRVIGLLGISSVVVGFVLVVIKLYRDHGFVWLIHRQLWVPVLAVCLYAVLPVDWLVNRYNVHQVQSGNAAPSVQIVAHRVSAEGVLPLVALVDCEDVKVRDGVKAILALWSDDLKNTGGSSYMRTYEGVYRGEWRSKFNHQTPWLMLNAGFSNTNRVTEKSRGSFQLSTYLLERELKRVEPDIEAFVAAPKKRDAAIEEFFKYAYQWY